MNPTPPRKALGRGLDSLLKPTPAQLSGLHPTTSDAPGLAQVPVSMIEANPMQPRRSFTETALQELAASIRQSGILQPLVVRRVRDRFQLIAGERRLRAARLVNLTHVPVQILTVNDAQALALTIIENLQREDLNPMEQARGFAALSQKFNLTQEEIAERTGKDRASIANYLRLLKLDPEVQALVEQNQLSMGHARALASLEAERQISLARRSIESGWSVRQLEKILQPAPAQPEKTPPPIDPNVKAAQEELEHALGTKIRIRDRNNRGTIEISYSNLEEFQRIFDMFVKA